MIQQTMRSICVVGLMLIGFGCRSHPVSVQAPAGNYQTVSAAPLRDTDSAKRANEAGLKHLHEGALDEGAEAFRKALEADVGYGPAHNNLGKVYYQQRDWYKAAWEFEYAKEQMPKLAEPRNNLGMVWEHAGEYDKAVEEYRAAVAMEPKHLTYVGNLARALIRRGDKTEEVRALLTQIAANDTREAWVTWARRELAGMGVKYE